MTKSRMKLLERDYEALALRVMQESDGDDQLAMQVGGLEIQSLQHQLEPAIQRIDKEIGETGGRVEALCDQVYHRADPPSDLAIIA